MKSNFTKMSPKQQDKSNTVKFHDDEKNGVTVCTLYDRWYGRRFIAKTRCHEVDQYDQQVGRAIAFNKARRKELLSDLEIINYQRKELTRMYEEEMSRLDKSEGLKHIYLAGVDEELRELMNGMPTFDETDDLTTLAAIETDDKNIGECETADEEGYEAGYQNKPYANPYNKNSEDEDERLAWQSYHDSYITGLEQHTEDLKEGYVEQQTNNKEENIKLKQFANFIEKEL